MTAIPPMIGSSGRIYDSKRLIRGRPLLGRLWLATSRSEKCSYILKDIPEAIFSSFNEAIHPRLPGCQRVRLPLDQIPRQRILVYKYLTDDFHSLVEERVSIRVRKQILEGTLHGLAELHLRDVVHLDIKPDNILVDRLSGNGETLVGATQISGLENAAYLPKGRCIKGMLPGNESWRSPGGHFRGELNKPSDVFSFGIICIYAMLGRVIFAVDDDFKKHESQGAIPYLIHLHRQVCYLGNERRVDGLLKHIGDDQINSQALQMLWEGRNDGYIDYTPFFEWREVENVTFKYLIQKMMCLDPAKRITAADALKHGWFVGV